MSGSLDRVAAEVAKEEADRLALLKAAFAAGYRVGHKTGEDEAVAFEHGTRRGPQSAEQAWADAVQWRIETDTSMRLDPNDIKAWEDVD